MLALSFAAPAAAAVELDQSQPAGLGKQSVQLMVQTFIAGKTGRLDHVDLKLFAVSGSLTVTVRQANADGTPAVPVSADPKVVLSGYMSGSNTFDFTKANISITKGTAYEIYAQRAGSVSWYFTSSPPTISPTFLGGKLYVGCVGCPSWYSGAGYGADFVFATYVNTSTVQLPTIAATTPNPMNVDEGTAPSAAGTFSDPNGDTVTLASTSGTVTPTTGTGSGTWSWTESVADEAKGQTVTVTVTDSHGLSASVQLAFVVNGVKPTVTITNDPPTVPEGTLLSLAGTAHSPDPADDAAGFNYLWSVSKDGGTPTTTPGASFNFTVADEGTYIVTLDATDDGGMTGTSSFTVVGAEVNPTAQIDSVKPTDSTVNVIAPQERLSFAGRAVDPATQDTHTATWNFGDGHTASGFAATNVYTFAGTYTVTLTVKDDDGATGQTSIQLVVTPQQALSSMDGYVNALTGLNGGQRNSLTSKLDNASASITRGETKAANNQLDAFLNELLADLNTGKISRSAYDTLRADAHAVQAALGTFNRFLEWSAFLA